MGRGLLFGREPVVRGSKPLEVILDDLKLPGQLIDAGLVAGDHFVQLLYDMPLMHDHHFHVGQTLFHGFSLSISPSRAIFSGQAGEF
jgi:hypothetical protein